MARTTEHKEGKATVKIVYYTSKTMAGGVHPLMVRITKDRKLKYVATGESLHPKYWNSEKTGYREAIRKSFPEPGRERLVRKLQELEARYSNTAVDLTDADQQYDASTVATKAVQERKQTRRVQLLAYIAEQVAAMMTAGRIGNASVYRDLGNQLGKFIQEEYATKDLNFEKVNVPFCNAWETALRASGAEDTTLSNRFRTLRAVLNRAIAANLMKADHYPFARTVAEKHKFSIGKFDVSTAKRATARDDIRLLEAFSPTNDRQRLAKEVFLFSFYGGGINFVDLAQLRWHNLSEADAHGHPQRLNYVRQKTGGKFSLRLLGPAAAIVAGYMLFTRNGPDSYVFPILDPTKHVSPTQIKNRLHKMLGQVNQDLKTLAELTGINAPLTTYVARHSFATTLRKSGTATALISQAMGHKSEAVTAIYLDSFASEQVDHAFESLL